jgi:hypothetical protein
MSRPKIVLAWILYAAFMLGVAFFAVVSLTAAGFVPLGFNPWLTAFFFSLTGAVATMVYILRKEKML